jgi:hypothetical protein
VSCSHGSALALGGCGRDDEASTDKPNDPDGDRWTEQDVIEAAGLTANDGGLSYTTASGCDVSVVMTNAARSTCTQVPATPS